MFKTILTGGIIVEVFKRIAEAGVVPTVYAKTAEKAAEAAKAVLKGGLDVLQLSFDPETGTDIIRKVIEACPEMLIGACATSLEQCRKAAESGAKFIVSPCFDGEAAAWCLENSVAIIPGCVTPNEIMAAVKMGINLINYFPAKAYGGLDTLKILADTFRCVSFIPSGDLCVDDIPQYVRAPFVHAVIGSWLCPESDVEAGNLDKITALCKEARDNVLGFQVVHMGINCKDAEEAAQLCDHLKDAFDFPASETPISYFSSPAIEVMKYKGNGMDGHIAIGTNSVTAAMAEIRKRGYELNMDSASYSGDKVRLIYIKGDLGGFAFHFIQK